MNKTTVDLLNFLSYHHKVGQIFLDYSGLVYFDVKGNRPQYRARGRWGKITVEYYDGEVFVWSWFHEGRYSWDEFEKWLEVT